MKKSNIEKIVKMAEAFYEGNGAYYDKFHYYYDFFELDTFNIYCPSEKRWYGPGGTQEPHDALDEIYEGGWHGKCFYKSLSKGIFDVNDRFWLVDGEVYYYIESINAATMEDVIIKYLQDEMKFNSVLTNNRIKAAKAKIEKMLKEWD